jgi:hypothetical protein
MAELVRTKEYDIDGFKVTVRSFNRPDPHVAAKAILPLILELWEKKKIAMENKFKEQ